MSVDALVVGRCVALRIGAAPLHRQEGANALDLALVAVVGQRLAFGAKPTRGHPLSVLLLLQDARRDGVRERQPRQRTKGPKDEACAGSRFHSADRPHSCPRVLAPTV